MQRQGALVDSSMTDVGESEDDLGDVSVSRFVQETDQALREFVESKGGRVLYMGTVDSMVIGESDAEFHTIGLVEYPSRKAFLEIASSGHVREIGQDRSKGLAGQWLIASTQVPLDALA